MTQHFDFTSDLDLVQSKLSFQFKLLKQPGLIRARQESLWLDDCLKLNGPSEDIDTACRTLARLCLLQAVEATCHRRLESGLNSPLR